MQASKNFPGSRVSSHFLFWRREIENVATYCEHMLQASAAAMNYFLCYKKLFKIRKNFLLALLMPLLPFYTRFSSACSPIVMASLFWWIIWEGKLWLKHLRCNYAKKLIKLQWNDIFSVSFNHILLFHCLTRNNKMMRIFTGASTSLLAPTHTSKPIFCFSSHHQ